MKKALCLAVLLTSAVWADEAADRTAVEATWYPAPAGAGFVLRSVTFVSPDTAVVVATDGPGSVVFVVKNENSNWRIASFRPLPEAQTKVVQ